MFYPLTECPGNPGLPVGAGPQLLLLPLCAKTIINCFLTQSPMIKSHVLLPSELMDHLCHVIIRDFVIIQHNLEKNK